MLSDNGLQMVEAENELRAMIKGWDKAKLKEYCADRGITWQFTTPLAPHQNECSECMVKRTNENVIKNRFCLNFLRKYKNVSRLRISYRFFKFLVSSKDFDVHAINHRPRQNVGHFSYTNCLISAMDYLH